MDVLDIGAKILDGGVGTLPEVTVGMVHIPQRPQPVGGKALQHGAQPGGIGVDAAGFQQQAHTGGFCHGQQRLQIFAHQLLVLRQRAGHYIGHPGTAGSFQHGSENGDSFGIGTQIHGGIKAGNFQLQVTKLAQGCRHFMGMERTAPVSERREFEQVIDLHTAEAHIYGFLEHFLPAQVAPATGRKGEIHTVSSS